MTAPRLEGRLADFLTESGYRVHDPDDAGGVTVRDSQVWMVVREDEGVLTVEMFERGASNGVHLRTRDNAVLQTYLALWVGGTWRSQHGLGFLRVTEATPDPRYTVVEERARVFGVRGPDGAWVAQEMLEVDAEELVVGLGHPLDDLLASYKDRNGAPAFARARRWRLWR